MLYLFLHSILNKNRWIVLNNQPEFFRVIFEIIVENLFYKDL